ncbi:MAG: cation:proton antiporter [Gemmatimonadetes bacterium]|nr:cation:proton antiporter [Gemmatimonadota bacterium]
MTQGVSLVTTIAAAFGLALVLGFVAVRLRLPALVGYLVAGIILGPSTPGLVADQALTRELAEIGVMLLMFGVGLHFSVEDLLAVRRIAIPGAIAQMTASTVIALTVARFWGWSTGGALAFGLSLSVASTVVVLRALESRGTLESPNGRIAVGWLVVQDLAMVLVLVLLPALSAFLGGTSPSGSQAGAAPGGALWRTLGLALGQVALFVALMLVVGKRLFPWILWQVGRTGSRELFTLCVIAAAVGVAYGSAQLFGVSFALGAFFAGMLLRESELSHRAADESLPLRDAFAVLFFVSVGMLFDPSMLVREPLHVLIVVGVIVVANPLAAFAIVILARYPLNTALTLAASFAQVGEFSFIMAGLGLSLGLLPTEGHNLVLAGALISIAVNPLVFRGIEPIQRWIRARSALARLMERRDDPLAELPTHVTTEYATSHIVLVGYGRVGQRIGESLRARGVHHVIIEQSREVVERLRTRGIAAVYGDASEAAVIIQGHIVRARMLVIAVPDVVASRAMIALARMLNPGVAVVARAHSDEEARLLRSERAEVFMGEHELAVGMTRQVLLAIGATTDRRVPSAGAGET